MSMQVHELKTYPQYFEQTLKGKKSFEIRLNDRNFQVGDIVVLKEWDGAEYSGRELTGEIVYILSDDFVGLTKDYVVLSLRFEFSEMVTGIGMTTVANKVVDTLSKVDLRWLKMPIAVIYEKPFDFPDHFVVRIFDVNIPTNVVYLSETLEDCRKEVSKIGLKVCFSRDKKDPKSVIETWC